MDLKKMPREELERLFEERKKALLEVRDEIDRRDAYIVRPSANVDFTRYVENGERD